MVRRNDFTSRMLGFVRIALIVSIPVYGLTAWRTWPTAPNVTMPSSKPKSVANSDTHAQAKPLDWYAPLWQRDMNQSPVPKAVPSPAPSPAVTAAAPILLATFVDGDHRYAHLRGASGHVHFTEVEESVDRFRVMAIEPGRVQLKKGQAELWIELPREGTP